MRSCPRIGVLAALPAEWRTLAPLRAGERGWTAVRTGMGRQAARRGAETMLADGVDLVVSWGCAAGLERGLAPGSVVIANAIVDTGGLGWPVAAAARHVLLQAIPPDIRGQEGLLAEATEPLVDAAAKHALACRTGAVVADMESAEIARAAARAGVGFIAVRAVADGVDEALPRAIARASGGGVRAGVELAATPGDWPALWRLMRGYRRAGASLARVAQSWAMQGVRPMDADRGPPEEVKP